MTDIAALVEARLPIRIDSDGTEDDWGVVGPAILVASVRHLRVIEQLQEDSPSAVVLWQLTRSLFEYVATFAWIAADPETHAKRWLKYDFDQRLKLDNDLVQLGAEAILDDTTRERLLAYEPELDLMPSLPQRAEEADNRWQETTDRLIEELGGEPDEYQRFRRLYIWLYRNGSRFTHPSSHVVEAFTRGAPPSYEVGAERSGDTDFARLATFLIALSLAIGAEALPEMGLARDEVVTALE